MPRYREIPYIGLYLDQTVKYINVVLGPLGCIEATPSMISNYVKKGYIEKPVKKLYSEAQIAKLLFIMTAKLVLSMDNIEILFKKQQEQSSLEGAYNAFCESLEQTLRFTFGLREDAPAGILSDSEGERLLQSVITTVSNAVYINHCFELMKETI